MASAEKVKPSCPVCHKSDQVKATQAAYDSGVTRCAPPDMPTKNISMSSSIMFSMVLVGICVFLIIVFIGSEATMLPALQVLLLGVTLVSIVTALVLSYMAFQRVVHGDAEASLQFPAWDRAMATWKGLYYCSQDDLVFDPKTNKMFSEAQLATLRTMDNEAPEVKTATVAHK